MEHATSGEQFDQCRQIYDALRRPQQNRREHLPLSLQQKRHTSLSEDVCMNLLREVGGINCGVDSGPGVRRYLAIGMDKSARSPCILASPTTDECQLKSTLKQYPFDYETGPNELAIERIAHYLQLSQKESTVNSLRRLVKSLASLFCDKRATFLSTSIVERLGEVKVVNAHFSLDKDNDSFLIHDGQESH
jgi:Succinyl-CoA synthetase, beta subunit